MSAVVLPAASAAFTSTQVIFSNSTRSVCARGAARADPRASIREAVPPAINISKECETEPMRMSFSFPQKHKLVAVLTESRQCYKFIIITIILPFPHDSEILPGRRAKYTAAGITCHLSLVSAATVGRFQLGSGSVFSV